jgi:UPF0755 protein
VGRLAVISNITGAIIKLVIGLVMIVVVVGVGLGIYFFFEVGASPSSNADLVPFTISPGENFNDVTQKLHKNNLIRNTVVFHIRAKMLEADQKLQVGDFFLRRNMNMDKILETVTNARLVERRVTIIEGLRLEQIAQILTKEGWEGKKFIELVRKGNFPQFSFLKDKPQGASVEGFLFPETYTFTAGMSEEDIINTMLKQFGEQYNTRLREKANQGIGIYKIVTMAALIEKETAKADERAIVSSVFYNRLWGDMRFDTDPTVLWARDTELYKKDNTYNKWWKTPITKEDLNFDSPYNTYKFKGFPPGPICNPGLASLVAATEPATTDYLFFVATGDREGSHAFAKTLEEHNENVKKYIGR